MLLLLPNFHTSTLASRQEQKSTDSDKQVSIKVAKTLRTGELEAET